MNMIRITLAIIFAALGIVLIGLVPLFIALPEGFGKRMNKVFFQPRADAEVDLLLEKGLFTPEQEGELRGFVRRLYISDGVVLTIGAGSGVVIFGVSLLSLAYSLKTAAKLSTLSRRLEAGQTGGMSRK